MSANRHTEYSRGPWNEGRLIGRKLPLKPSEVWAIRVRLEVSGDVRALALLNLGIDSKLRGCDLVTLKVRDVMQGGSWPRSDTTPFREVAAQYG